MKFVQYFKLSLYLILILILITSCGVNNPNTTNNTTNTGNKIPTTTINAYQDTTHGYTITSGAIDILLQSNQLTEKQKSILKDYRAEIEAGAVEEDNPLIAFRFLNHFYDPEYIRPLTDMGLTENSTGLGMMAIDWVKNGDSHLYIPTKTSFLQTIPNYNPSFRSNPPAVTAEMATNMKNLGHTLHMFQDMTSVPHTRNDAHPPIGTWGSIYEEYCKTYQPNLNNIAIVNITQENDLWVKFHKLALFTNHNFYSDDSIPDAAQVPWRTYVFPSLPQGTGYLSGGKDITVNPLVFAAKNPQTKIISYTVRDDANNISKAYADILVPEAISYTAGVIKYFLSLKGDGRVIIDNPVDNSIVNVPSVNISGSLTYYAASATVYYHSALNLPRTKMEIPVILANGKYTFTATVPLELGANNIEVVADNENVNATSDRITVTYKKPNNVLEVVISDPIDGQVFPDRIISVSGMVNYFSGNSAILSVNDRIQTIPVANSGYFKADVILTSGSNTITVKVSDRGQIASDAVHVICTVPPSKLWVQLTWDQGGSDVDLYVTEPTGETAWYAYPRNTSGGYLDVDNTWGYGPEHYMISESLGNNIAPGDYVIQVHYYASHGNPAGITGQLTVLKDEKPYGVFPFSISQPNPSSAGPGNWIIDPASWWQEVRVTLP